MDRRGQASDRDSLASALVTLHRYSLDITEIALQTLGGYDIENRDIQFVLAVHRAGPLTPTEMVERMAAPRSTVSRALNRLEVAGLAVRIPDERDRRSVRIALTLEGRRRVTAFATRLGDYFTHGEPTLKEAFHLLGVSVPDPDPVARTDPMAAAEAMGAAGAGYVADAVRALQPFGISEVSDRYAIALLHLRGSGRPTQLADELGLTRSGTSGMLARLERAGLLTRRHDLIPGDRRAVVVELTARGLDAADRQLDAFARHATALQRALALTWPVR
jgi:DNA-binding MarR family transcriptional regulator